MQFLERFFIAKYKCTKNDFYKSCHKEYGYRSASSSFYWKHGIKESVVKEKLDFILYML